MTLLTTVFVTLEQKVERVPVWMMRQAGRHMKVSSQQIQNTFKNRVGNLMSGVQRFMQRSQNI